MVFVFLVSGALVTSSLVELYFANQENQASLSSLQRKEATAAATTIEQFVKGIERQIAWTIQPAWVSGAVATEQRRNEFNRLLRLSPAVTTISFLDRSGEEQIRISRLAMNVVGQPDRLFRRPDISRGQTGRTYFGPVYFRNGSEPYMIIAMAEGGLDGGVVVGEVDLTAIWDVISQITIGQDGGAYVVDSSGQLIAHPDLSLVLAKTDLSALPQVASLSADGGSAESELAGARVATDLHGRQVLTSHQTIEPLGWSVFVEQPLDQVVAPLYWTSCAPRCCCWSG